MDDVDRDCVMAARRISVEHSPRMDNAERQGDIIDLGQRGTSAILLDPDGYPLHPQPSSDPLDPLNWSFPIKLVVLLQVSWLAFLGPFSHGFINPAYRPMADTFDISISKASYQTTVAIAFSGFAPLLYAPLSNLYGRRPIYLLSAVVGIAAGVGSALAKSYGGVLASRCFVGAGTSAGMGIGTSVVADMFFVHQRGKMMGIYIVFLTNGAHIAAICGGFVAKYTHSWRWCYWVPTIAQGITLIFNVFLLPETLYQRYNSANESRQENITGWLPLFTFRNKKARRWPRWYDFTHAFIMLKYPSVLFTFIYYSYAFAFGTVLFAVTGAAAFGKIYHFDASQVGLTIGVSTTVGSVVGEFFSGPVSDFILLWYRKRSGGELKLETRLYATWPASILLPAGVIIEGVCFQYKSHWISPCIGIVVGSFGLQMISTNIFAYLADCYKPQSAQIGTILGFGRQSFSFTLGFYMIPFAESTTYGTAWSVMACVSIVLYIGILLLIWNGQHWREKLGAPGFHYDL